MDIRCIYSADVQLRSRHRIYTPYVHGTKWFAMDTNCRCFDELIGPTITGERDNMHHDVPILVFTHNYYA